MDICYIVSFSQSSWGEKMKKIKLVKHANTFPKGNLPFLVYCDLMIFSFPDWILASAAMEKALYKK